MEARARWLFFVLVVLTGASTTVLVANPGNQLRRQPATDSFQQVLGGLGFGPAVDLSGCAFALDPRLEGSCSANVGPIPGGACFCGRHTGLLSCPPRSPHESVPAPGGTNPLLD